MENQFKDKMGNGMEKLITRRDNGQYNGNPLIEVILGLWYIGIMEKKMESTVLLVGSTCKNTGLICQTIIQCIRPARRLQILECNATHPRSARLQR